MLIYISAYLHIISGTTFISTLRIYPKCADKKMLLRVLPEFLTDSDIYSNVSPYLEIGNSITNFLNNILLWATLLNCNIVRKVRFKI